MMMRLNRLTYEGVNSELETLSSKEEPKAEEPKEELKEKKTKKVIKKTREPKK